MPQAVVMMFVDDNNLTAESPLLILQLQIKVAIAEVNVVVGMPLAESIQTPNVSISL